MFGRLLFDDAAQDVRVVVLELAGSPTTSTAGGVGSRRPRRPGVWRAPVRIEDGVCLDYETMAPDVADGVLSPAASTIGSEETRSLE